jgi:hypothetical protein
MTISYTSIVSAIIKPPEEVNFAPKGTCHSIGSSMELQ